MSPMRDAGGPTDAAPGLRPVKVRIRWFQSIEDAELEIRGFTCITGKTNIGKSAVVRAIAGAFQNAPVVGDVRKGAKFCSVSMSSDTWGFRWEKSEKGGGTYYMDGSEKLLDKIGQGPVEEISALGFGSVKVGDDHVEPWLAPQWEPIFLLNKSGPSVTDFISGVSRLTVLQDAIILSLRDKKKLLDGVKAKTEAMEKLRSREAAISGLDVLVGLSSELEAQAQSISEYERRIASAENLLKKITRAREMTEALAKSPDVRIPPSPDSILLQRLKAMELHWRKCESAALRIKSLWAVSGVVVPSPPEADLNRLKLSEKIHGLRKTVEILKDVGKVRIPKIDSGDGLGRLKAAEAHLTRLTSAAEAVKALRPVSVPKPPESPSRLSAASRHQNRISQLRMEISELDRKLVSVSDDLKKASSELKKIPSCSTCGRPTFESHPHAKVR